MKTISTIIIFTATILLCQCNGKKTRVHYPPDFGIQLTATTINYDSQKQLYTRHYVDKISSVNVALTEKELQSIFEYIHEIEFIHFPNKFECEKYGIITEPSFLTSIEVSFDGQSKRSTNTTGCSPKTQLTNSENFDRLAGKIIQILDSKKAVKNLPETDLVFL